MGKVPGEPADREALDPQAGQGKAVRSRIAGEDTVREGPFDSTEIGPACGHPRTRPIFPKPNFAAGSPERTYAHVDARLKALTQEVVDFCGGQNFRNGQGRAQPSCRGR